MARMIIVEGVDKTGKTTLVNELHRRFGGDIVKCSQPSGDPYLEYTAKLREAELRDVTIFDRLHLGELVYGPIYRKRSQLDDTQVRTLTERLRFVGATYVHVTGSIERVVRKFADDYEKFAKTEDVERLLAAYRIVFLTVVPSEWLLTYDYEHDTVDSLCDALRLKWGTKD